MVRSTVVVATVGGDCHHGPMDADAVLADLDPEQRQAATALSGPVCILAGAGTGKTRAITHRIAYAVLSGRWRPQQVLAVTFTTRAAGEMRGRLRELGAQGVQARTFHSAALRQARYFWPRAYGQELPPIVDSKLRYVAEAASRCRVPADLAGRKDLASEIEWAKVSNVRPDDYERVADQAGRQPTYDPPTVARVFAAYEQVRRDRGFIDLEDVLLCTVALLADQPSVARAVREQYRHFVVDEYQDVSPLQQALLDQWRGERDDVCVVGDASQTIYSFAGASPDYLLDFTDRFPAATVVRLERDYRSTPQVVKVANGILAHAKGRGAAHRLRLRAQRSDGPPPVFTEYADETEEAEAIANQVRAQVDGGVPAREIAVLFRVNAQSEAFEQALGERGLSYLVRGAERFFERPEVKQAIVLVRGASRASDPTDGRMEGDLVAEVQGVLAGAGWSPSPPTGSGQTRERWESLEGIVELARGLVKEEPRATMAMFAQVLDERAAAQHAPAVDGVTLATLHAAKGLEWDSVFLAGCHEGTMPISYAETAEQIEEERRLLYVGVTRARERLSISWARSRNPGGRGRRSPSRFLDSVRPVGGSAGDEPLIASGSIARRRGGSRSGRSVASCRSCDQPLHDAAERKLGRCADCPASYDEQLYERLRTWRSGRAQEQKVPAYCVFTDATLTAIAEECPSDHATLARIPGVGAAKLDKYGSDVLEICAGKAVETLEK